MIRETSTEITIPFAFRLPDCQVEDDRKECPYKRVEQGSSGLHSREEIAALFRVAPEADLHTNLVRKNINSEYELTRTLTLLAKNNQDQTNGIAFLGAREQFDAWLNSVARLFMPFELDYSDASKKLLANYPGAEDHIRAAYAKSKHDSFFNYLSHIHQAFDFNEVKGAAVFFLRDFRLSPEIYKFVTNKLGQNIPRKGNFILVVNEFDN